ncbi:MAG TPA: GyrI-like domain-containing protein [Thermoleophilia bacterium]|nr:GyrI-like domain-containing protein [Thermoleophilia bacterium]
MSDDITIKDLPAQRIAAVRATTTMDKVGEAMQSGWQTILARGAVPTGPPFAIYHRFSEADGEVELETCLPTTTAVPGSETVAVRDEPAMRVAAVVHRGPYAGIGAAYEALQAWVAAEGRKTVGPPREVYLTDPRQVADPQDYLTEVQWPVE